MKKFTQTSLIAFCFIALVSCHKEVKKPVAKAPGSNATSTTTKTITNNTGTQTTTQGEGGHTCGQGGH